MRRSIARTLELIAEAEDTPAQTAGEALRALRGPDLAGLRRVALGAKYIDVAALGQDDRAAVSEAMAMVQGLGIRSTGAMAMVQDRRGPGRPPTGTSVKVNIPPATLEVLDAHANGNRAQLIRDILADWADRQS